MRRLGGWCAGHGQAQTLLPRLPAIPHPIHPASTPLPPRSVVAQVRRLLEEADGGPDPEGAAAELEGMFSLEGGRDSTFGYLQVVNPQVGKVLLQRR